MKKNKKKKTNFNLVKIDPKYMRLRSISLIKIYKAF